MEELRTSPLTPGELFSNDPIDEKVMIARINQCIMKGDYKESLKKHGRAILPCGIVDRSNIHLCQKAFSHSKGWYVYECAYGHCGTDCENYVKGAVAKHIALEIVQPQPKIVPEKKVSIWSKLFKWKK